MMINGEIDAIEKFEKLVRLKCLGLINLATEYEHLRKNDLALIVYEDARLILSKYLKNDEFLL